MEEEVAGVVGAAMVAMDTAADTVTVADSRR